MISFPIGGAGAEAWRVACEADAVLGAWAGPWSVCFAVRSDEREEKFSFVDGKCVGGAGVPDFCLAAPGSVWGKFLEAIPPRHYHGMFAMLRQVPEFSMRGDERVFAQFCHVARRVLEVGKFLARGGVAPVPVSLHPPLGDDPAPVVTGGYVPVTAGGTTYRVYYETAGNGPDILCLHTAGADGRQFHRLMADARVCGANRLVAFDLPWHGKSPPPAGAVPGSWRLNTELYVDLIMGFVRATGLRRPVVLGASMSGEICLELALRHPEAFSAIVACEASEKIERRQSAWASHPQVNQSHYIPEWILSLAAPQSPAECVADIYWHYAQGGQHVFAGDIAFYSGDWDARERVRKIDTKKCPLFMLTGEYDYSCTAEHSAATAAKIAGVRFQVMPGMGHFPFAENPRLFAEYLLPILREVRGVNSA
jgi:pimeloyl-ACP methyl ester carboxylesterase